ncbi:Zinc finger CCCH domain-containing protein 23 [Nymphaea thermarum]|nr:Zinc finger CCCH domain-containing protein 23 [Nymphaea thermarum]
MDAYEATRIVFTRIQCLDPENAPKIMGLLLIQDHGEKEMIRLAFGPESLVQSTTVSAPVNSFNIGGSLDHPCASPSLHRQDSGSRNGFYGGDMVDDFQLIQDQLSFLNDHTLPPSSSATASSSSSLSSSSPLPASSASANPNPNSLCVSPRDDYSTSGIYGDILDSMNNSNDDRVLFPYASWEAANSTNNAVAAPSVDHHHRRSCSLADLCLSPISEMGSSFPWKPCMYYARGYCKNGSNCRFLHGFLDNGMAGCVSPTAAGSNRADMTIVDPTSAMAGGGGGKISEQAPEQCASDLLRPKTQRSASLSQQLVPPPLTFGKCSSTHPFPIDGYHLPADNLRSSRMERNDFGNPGSRQIYLTFPADSTFREEDVSNYFSIYGPVQDVRIPYQQKRMFGFVTFVYPETVKIILAKGNPHYVCDARVLVKPYKEKGKIAEKKHGERGEFSGCPSPTSLDSRDAYELQLGGRIFYNSHEAFRRKLEEQAELQQAIELESKRLMGFQLADARKRPLAGRGTGISQCNHLSSSPSSSSDALRSPDVAPPEVASDYCPISPAALPSEVQQAARSCQQLPAVGCTDKESTTTSEGITCSKEEDSLQDSLEHNLPDSPFASPTKHAAASANSMFSLDRLPFNGFSNNLSSSPLLPATSTLDVASIRSCYFQMPRFASDRGAIGM